MTTKIECKDERCLGPDEGCPTCGGYQYVLGPAKCTKCSRMGLVNPGARTVYEGRRFRTIDGVGFVYTDLKSEKIEMLCFQCEGEK